MGSVNGNVDPPLLPWLLTDDLRSGVLATVARSESKNMLCRRSNELGGVGISRFSVRLWRRSRYKLGSSLFRASCLRLLDSYVKGSLS